MRNRDHDGFMDYLYPDDREAWEDSEEAFNAHEARREDEAEEDRAEWEARCHSLQMEEQALDDLRREGELEP